MTPRSDAEAVVASIRAGGGAATAAKIDVTSEAEWAGLIAKPVATYRRFLQHASVQVFTARLKITLD